jgi:hypothetical protein
MIKPRSPHSKSNFTLERILWRWENDWYDEGTVSNIIDQYIDDLATRSSKLSGKKHHLRRFHNHYEDLKRFDQLRGEIKRNLGRMEFRQAVIHIKECYKILVALEASIPVIEHYDYLEKLMKELINLSGKKLFASTPTMKILSNLQAKTNLYLEAMDTKKAKLNIFFCLEEIKHLLTTKMNKPKSEKLKGKISYISEVLEQSQKVKSLGKNKKKYFLITDKLLELAERNYLVLAERLLGDFETEISDRISYMAYQNISLKIKHVKLKQSKKGDQKFRNYFNDKARYGLKRNLKVNLNHLKNTIGQLKKSNEKEE